MYFTKNHFKLVFMIYSSYVFYVKFMMNSEKGTSEVIKVVEGVNRGKYFNFI